MKTTLKSRLLAGTAIVSLFALSACGQDTEAAAEPAATEPATVTVEHTQGSTEVPVNPETVYTFDLGALDTMDALGIEVDGVPSTNYPESLAKYGSDDYAKIGSMKEPDFEAIAAAAPDLIIMSGRTANYYEDFSEIAPTIDLSTDAVDSWSSFVSNTEIIGEIFGKEAEVEEKLAALDTKVEETKATAADAGNGLIILTSGGKVTAYGAGSRFGLIHDVLGVATAADIKSEAQHGESVPFEYVAEINPDHLFVIDRDVAVGNAGEVASAVLDNELVKGTKAAQNENITMLDSSSWYLVGYGLNNVDAMVSAVQDSIS